MSRDWVTVEGVRYVPEAPLKAEIARLRDTLESAESECAKLRAQLQCRIARLRAALEHDVKFYRSALDGIKTKFLITKELRIYIDDMLQPKVLTKEGE